MANTRYLTTVVEEHVRNLLGERYGFKFEKRKLTLVTGGAHEFDAVSLDGSVVASIKTASGVTSGGKQPSGKVNNAVAELYFLSLVEAPTRLLILTTPSFFHILQRTLAGKVAPGIELRCEPLPEALQAEVAAVQLAASQEIFPTKPQ